MNYYETLFNREQDYAERAERMEREREQIAAGTHYYDRNTGTVREKAPGCCQQCDDHDAVKEQQITIRHEPAYLHQYVIEWGDQSIRETAATHKQAQDQAIELKETRYPDASIIDECDECGKPIEFSGAMLCEECYEYREMERQAPEISECDQLGELPHGGWRRS